MITGGSLAISQMSFFMTQIFSKKKKLKIFEKSQKFSKTLNFFKKLKIFQKTQN